MNKSLITVGWREWLPFPCLGLPWLMAKIDSGRQPLLVDPSASFLLGEPSESQLSST